MRSKNKKFCLSKSRVILNQELAQRRFLLRFEAPEIAKKALPGQFIQVKVGGFDPLLPRPFAVSWTENDYIEILVEVRGKGSSLLAKAQEGESFNLLGPLGKGFSLPKGNTKNLVLVAGGIGLAPLRFLAWEASKNGYFITLLYGDKNQSCFLPLKKLLPEKVLVRSIVEEKNGQTGMVTDLLKDVIEEFKDSCFFVCGPKAMLKEVYGQLARKKIVRAQFSFEERMSCGYGACLGCVVLTKKGYKRVCLEGPVFEGEEIIWESI